MNRSAAVGVDVPPELATVTSTVPVPAGLSAVIRVAELTEKAGAEVAPNRTDVASVKPVPVMITVVPPPPEPKVGLMPVTVGAPVV